MINIHWTEICIMTESEDSHLNNLQEEFQKLCVDFNRYYTSANSLKQSAMLPTTVTSNHPLSDNAKILLKLKKIRKMSSSRSSCRNPKKLWLLSREHNSFCSKDLSSQNQSRCLSQSPKSHNKSLKDCEEQTKGEISSKTVSMAVSNSSHCDDVKVNDTPFSPLPDIIDEITVDELAGYFDTFVHIPKKMSHMAKMMYT